jgi:hypothetical protein
LVFSGIAMLLAFFYTTSRCIRIQINIYQSISKIENYIRIHFYAN